MLRPRPPSRHKTAKPRPLGSHISGPGRGAITSSPFWGWAALHVATGHFAHASPAHSRRKLVSAQVGLTTVAPCRPATGSMPEGGDQKRGRSVSLPRPAYPPESSGGSAGTFQRGSCKAILQDMDQSSTARHYRQAKHDSQNLLNIATRIACRQPIPQDLPLHSERSIAETANKLQ